MTRSRFFSSRCDELASGSSPAAAAAAAAAAATKSTTMASNSSSSNSSSNSTSSSRWRRPRLRRSHAHEFNEELLPENKNNLVTPALSQASLGSGHTEAPSSRGTSASTLSTCSPALTAVEDDILEVEDFELDGGDDDSSWLDADLPPLVVLPAAAAADDDADSDFDEESEQQQQQQQQRQHRQDNTRFAGPLVLHVQDFECGECVGKGSYSRVYLGTHPLTGTEWALKVVSKRKTFETRENLAHLREEKYVSTKLEGSDFLVRTAGTFQNTRSVVFAMEYLPGGDLYQRLSDKGTLSLGEAVAWTAQAVLAIEDLHARNIVHRDVKPENFLMGKSGTLKLTDFGFARELEPEGRLYSQFGTPEYVAPEVLNGCGHGMAVDLWALGVLIYELLVGQTPFKSSSVDEMYERIAAGDYAFPAAPSPPAERRTRSTKGAPKSSSLADVQKVGGGGGGDSPKQGLSLQKAVSQPQAPAAEGVAMVVDSNNLATSKYNTNGEQLLREQQQQQQPAQLENPSPKQQQKQKHSKSNSTKRTAAANNNTTTTTNRTTARSSGGGGTTDTNTTKTSAGAGAQDPAAQSLVKALLCLSPGRRPSVPDIKRHPFFAGVDFAGLRAAVRAQTVEEEEEAVVSAAINGGEVWVRGQPVVCRSEEADDNYGGVFEGF